MSESIMQGLIDWIDESMIISGFQTKPHDSYQNQQKDWLLA